MNKLKINNNDIYGDYKVLYEVLPRTTPAVYWHCQCKYCKQEKNIRSSILKNQPKCKCQHKIDMVGEIYGQFKVLAKTDKLSKGKNIIFRCQCIHCGHIIEIPSNILRKKNKLCPNCQSPKTTLVDMSNQIIGNLKVLKRSTDLKYCGHEQDAYWICECLLCGSIKTIRGIDIRQGRIKSCGCQNSKGELAIKQLLYQNNILFQSQYSFPDLVYKNKLYFDFAVFNNDGTLNRLIEYDGIQHFMPIEHFGGQEEYEKTVLRDTIKNQYCKDNKIKLIRIKYDEEISLERIMK